MLEGVIIKSTDQFSDQRGWLSELFRLDELASVLTPAMAYVSMTLPGVSRGPHEHLDQTDYFVFLTSRFKVHLWDNRLDSKTFREEIVFETDRNPSVVIVPPRVIHGYMNVGSENGLVLNLPNRLYRGFGKREFVDEIRHEESSLYVV